jgi:hypothetical protein
MPMNKKIYRGLISLLLLAAVSMSVAQGEPENQASVPETVTTPSEDQLETTSKTTGVDPDSQQAADQAPPAIGAEPRAIKEFKPTEQIEADAAVSFPIDI